MESTRNQDAKRASEDGMMRPDGPKRQKIDDSDCVGAGVKYGKVLHELCVAIKELNGHTFEQLIRRCKDLYLKPLEKRHLQMLCLPGGESWGPENSKVWLLFVVAAHGFYQACNLLIELVGENIDRGTTESNISPLYIAASRGHDPVVELLLQHKANVNFTKHDGSSVLYGASKHGFLNTVQILGRYGADAKASKKNGMSPLHVAAQNGHWRVCNYLLESLGADVSQTSDSGSTALHLAAYQKQETVIENLLKYGACVDARDDCGWTPIHVAAQAGSASIVRRLAKAPLIPSSSLIGDMRNIARELIGADYVPGNYGEDNGTTTVGANHVTRIPEPFFTTLSRIDWSTANLATLPIDVIQILRLNRRKADEYTPLMVTSRSGVDSSVTECLLELGANPRGQLSEGVTPLMIAAKNGRLKHVSMLTSRLEKNDILVGTLNHAWNALHWAAKGGHVQVVRHLMDLPGVFEVDLPVINGMTALYIASHHGHVSVVKCLIKEYNADPNWSIDSGACPLYTACKHGQLEVVQFLTKEGNVSIDAGNLRGSTPLHTAAKYNHLEIVKYLEDELNMEVSARNHQGWTPIHSAARAGALEVLKHFVEKYGAEFVSTIRTTAGNRMNRSPDFTPLHLAAANGCISVVRFLVDPRHVGAHVNVACGDGSTAATLASREGHDSVAEWLKRAAHWSKIHFIVDAREPDALLRLLTSEDRLDCEETRYLLNQTDGDFKDSPLSLSLLEPAVGTNQVAFVNLRDIIARTIPRTLTIQPYFENKFAHFLTEPEQPFSCLKVCDRTAATVIMAMIPWTPQTHHLYPPSYRNAIRTMMLVNSRKSKGTATESLPMELLFRIFTFLPRC